MLLSRQCGLGPPRADQKSAIQQHAAAALFHALGGVCTRQGGRRSSRSHTASANAAAALSQVACHNTPADCWLSFLGSVYDVTRLVRVRAGVFGASAAVHSWLQLAVAR